MMQTAARIISFIFFPYFIIPIEAFLIFNRQAPTMFDAVLYTGIVGFIILVVFIFELIGVRKGMFSNIDVTKRKQRKNFYLFVLLVLAITVGIAFLVKAPSYFTATAISLFIGLLCLFLVNMKTKVSVHVTTITALIIMITLLYGGWFYIMVLLVPLIAWSRIITNRHTKTETLAGVGMGIFISTILYFFLKYYPG